MRISFQTGFRDALADIQRSAKLFADSQREVSSGSRLQAPSDDPLAASAAVTEHAALGSIDRYSRTSSSVTSRLSVADTVLGDIVSQLTAAQTSATGTLGDTATTAQREAAARELAGIRDAILGDLNTNYRGVYLFSGSKSTSQSFTQNPDGTVNAYQGDNATLRVDIDRTSSVQITFDGSAVAQGSDAQDVFAVIEQLRTDILAGNTPGIQAGIDGLKRAFDRATKMQTEVGTDEKTLGDQTARLSDEKLGATTRLSKLEDADMAEAISSMNRAQAGYQAALGAAATITRVSLLDYLK